MATFEPNSKLDLVQTCLGEVTALLNKANIKLREEDLDDAKLTTAYKDGLDIGAKDDVKKAFQLLFWLGITHFGLPLPAELDDADIDIVNPDIRQRRVAVVPEPDPIVV
jgi:hypothetical protein